MLITVDEIRPIYSEAEYQALLIELMAIEAEGLTALSKFGYIEIISELMDAFKAKHNTEQWCQLHGIIAVKE